MIWLALTVKSTAAYGSKRTRPIQTGKTRETHLPSGSTSCINASQKVLLEAQDLPGLKRTSFLMIIPLLRLTDSDGWKWSWGKLQKNASSPVKGSVSQIDYLLFLLCFLSPPSIMPFCFIFFWDNTFLHTYSPTYVLLPLLPKCLNW